MSGAENERSGRPILPLAGGISCAGALVLFLYLNLPLLGHPFGVEYEEGVVLDMTGRIIEGQAIYTDLERPPFVLDRYGPLYPYAAAYLSPVLGYGWFAGRLMSFLASLGSAFLTFSLLKRFGAARVAVFGAAFFLLSPETLSFGALHRPEPVGVFLGLLAFALALREDRFRFLAPLSALGAALTTPLAAAGSIGAWATSFRRSRREGAVFGAVFLLGTAGAGVYLWLSRGAVVFSHLLPFTFPFGSERLWERFSGPLLLKYGPALLLAGVGFAGAWKRGEKALLLFGAWALGAGMRAGFEREDEGVLLEAVCALALFFALSLKRSFENAKVRRAVAGLSLLQAVLFVSLAGNRFFPPHLENELRERDGKVMRLLAGDFYVLSDNPCYPALTKKGLYLEPRTYRALVRMAVLDERDLLEEIRRGDFKLAVFQYEVSSLEAARGETPSGPGLLSLAVRRELKKVLPLSKTFTLKSAPARYVLTEVRAVEAGPPR